MSSFLIYFFMAISLSMDAFSLAFSLSMNHIEKNQTIKISCLVGLFHLIMPFLGSKIGFILQKIEFIRPNLIAVFIFLLLIIEMIRERKKETRIISLSKLTIVLLSFTVSIASFSVGIALSMNQENILLASILFSIISSTITKLGFLLGNIVSKNNQKKIEIIGILILIFVTIYYYLKGQLTTNIVVVKGKN